MSGQLFPRKNIIIWKRETLNKNISSMQQWITQFLWADARITNCKQSLMFECDNQLNFHTNIRIFFSPGWTCNKSLVRHIGVLADSHVCSAKPKNVVREHSNERSRYKTTSSNSQHVCTYICTSSSVWFGIVPLHEIRSPSDLFGLWQHAQWAIRAATNESI